MSSRERWTVYPLLFLTLGIALKDKVTRVVSTDQIVCRKLFVTDQLGNSQVVIGSSPQGGVATLEGASRSVDVSVGHFPSRVSGMLITDANGKLIQGVLVPSSVRAVPRQRPGDSDPSAAPENVAPEQSKSSKANEEPPQIPSDSPPSDEGP